MTNKKFRVTRVETYYYTFDVEAENQEQAEKIAGKHYDENGLDEWIIDDNSGSGGIETELTTKIN